MVQGLQRPAGIAFCLLALLGSGGVARAQDPLTDPKTTFTITCSKKGGLSDEDRLTIEQYLTEREERLAAAPESLTASLLSAGRWGDVFQAFATPVPKRLARSIAPPAEGTTHVIFNRWFLVIDASDGRVIQRVTANHHAR